MKLQVALDFLELDEAMAITAEIVVPGSLMFKSDMHETSRWLKSLY